MAEDTVVLSFQKMSHPEMLVVNDSFGIYTKHFLPQLVYGFRFIAS